MPKPLTTNQNIPTRAPRHAQAAAQSNHTIDICAKDGTLLAQHTRRYLAPAATARLKEALRGGEFHAIPYRGRNLRRGDKRIWKRSASVRPYRWGQEKRAYDAPFVEVGFPDWLRELADKLDPRINHAIALRYTDGQKHHIPWHSDKQVGTDGGGTKDIAGGTDIWLVVACDVPRRFQLAFPHKDMRLHSGHGEPPSYVFDEPLEDGDLLRLTAEGNCQLRHRVPRELGWIGLRYSLVLRVIA